eukprot:3027486-Pyramimonas_sp.AAC.1
MGNRGVPPPSKAAPAAFWGEAPNPLIANPWRPCAGGRQLTTSPVLARPDMVGSLETGVDANGGHPGRQILQDPAGARVALTGL